MSLRIDVLLGTLGHHLDEQCRQGRGHHPALDGFLDLGAEPDEIRPATDLLCDRVGIVRQPGLLQQVIAEEGGRRPGVHREADHAPGRVHPEVPLEGEIVLLQILRAK